jgi:hypothetical protein
VTTAIPLQLEDQWLTVAWALEGAALALLTRRLSHPLVPWASFTLGLVVAVRLVLNPYALEYGDTSGLPLLNWTLYTWGLPLVCLLLTARRQVQERQLVEAIEALFARLDLVEDGDDLLHPLLGLPHEEGVDEVCEWHRVRRTRTASEDDRVGVGAVGAADRDLREIDQLEHVRVRELGLQRDAEQVDIAYGAPRLERKQRHVVATTVAQEDAVDGGPHRAAVRRVKRSPNLFGELVSAGEGPVQLEEIPKLGPLVLGASLPRAQVEPSLPAAKSPLVRSCSEEHLAA